MMDGEWNGSRMGGDVLALAVLVAPMGETSRLILLAVAGGSGRCLVRPEAVGPFLRVHRDVGVTCHDAARLHWTILDHLTRAEDREALEILWGFSRDMRLADVGLLEQLGDLAERGFESPFKPLAKLAPGGVQATLTDEPDEEPRSRFARAIDVSWEDVTPALKSAASKTAATVLEVYRDLIDRAALVVESLDEDLDTGTGPLSLGVQVQGSIALHLASNSAGLRPGALAGLLECCHDAYRDASLRLHAVPAARQCFKWDEGVPIVKRDRDGRPLVYDDRLTRWLAVLLEGAPGACGVSFQPPRTDKGKIARSSLAWSDLAPCHPLIQAWIDLDSASRAERTLGRAEGSVSHWRGPEYQVLPRIRSRNPNLEMLRGVDPRTLFRPPAGKVFLIGLLRDLELRCLASLSLQAGWVCRLAGLFQAGKDPNRFVAAALSGRQAYGDDGPFLENFAALRETDRALYDGWIIIAGVIMAAAAGGLSAQQAYPPLKALLGGDLAQVDVASSYRFVINFVLPELQMSGLDRTWQLVSRALGLDSHKLFVLAGQSPQHYEVRLRDVLSGRKYDPDLIARLRGLASDESWRERLAEGRGDPEIYDTIFRRPRCTGLGRVRAGLEFHQANAAVHRDMADDLRKTVLFALVAGGHELVASVSDEFVLLIPAVRSTWQDGVMTGAVLSLVEAAANEYLEPIPALCSVRIADTWSPGLPPVPQDDRAATRTDV